MDQHLSRDGRKYIIRQPNETDAAGIIHYSKILFASTDQVLTTPEEYAITIENEKIWINDFIKNSNSLLLVAEYESQIIGMLFFVPNSKKKNSHTGEFGVNVHPEFQGIGIGRKLIQMLIDWAKENSKIEKVTLSVFATNKKAIQLYRNLGFIEEGRLVKSIKQISGEYVDTLLMYLETNCSLRHNQKPYEFNSSGEKN